MELTLFVLTAALFYVLGVATGRNEDNFKE